MPAACVLNTVSGLLTLMNLSHLDKRINLTLNYFTQSDGGKSYLEEVLEVYKHPYDPRRPMGCATRRTFN